MEQLTKNQAVATSQEAVQNQNEPQLRDENAHNDKSVHGVLNPTYQAGLRRDAVQPDIEAERKKRDEIEAGLTHVFFCVSKNVSVSCAYTQGKREQFSGFNRTLDAINNVFRKFSAFHDETGRLNVDGMNIISNDGSNKLNRSRKARVSYKVQRTINASLNAATSTRAVSSNPNFVTRQKIEIIFG